MIYQFPYTDLYNLNLDWMIKAIKEMQEIVGPLSSVVNSVNDMTGDVVITRQFLMGILESMVSTFNGRDGAVTLTAADVNGTLIDITWTSDPGDVIGDLNQNTLNQLYADGKRVLIFINNQSVPDTMYFLTLVGNVVTPQIYSPTAALAGVSSFNGQTGAVTATGSDLDTADDDTTPISESIGDLQTTVSNQSQQIDNLQAAAAYVEDGDTATLKTYSEGEYIVWKGSLYTVNSGGIPAGTAITGNVTAVTGGGFNTLNNGLNALNSKLVSDIVDISYCTTYDEIFNLLTIPIHTIGRGMCGASSGMPLATLIGDPLGNYSRCFVESFGTYEYRLLKITATGSFENVAGVRYVKGVPSGDSYVWYKTNWQTLAYQ